MRTAVIGLGILGEQHARYLADRPDVTLSAVADIDSARAEATAAHTGARAYSDAAQMLAEQKLELVVIATPDHLHRAPFLVAVDAGVPSILLEKPLATTVGDAEAMATAATRAGAEVYVNYRNRGSALDRATHYVIQHGLLGEVVYCDAHLDDNICVPTEMWGDRSRDWTAATSTAHFLLSHVVDYLRWTLAPAEVAQVYAISQRTTLQHTVDLYDAFLRFDSGARVRMKADWTKHIDGLVEFALEYNGTRGYLKHIKRAGFGEREGWRANLTAEAGTDAVLAHQEALAVLGIDVQALVHRPNPASGELRAGGGTTMRALQSDQPDPDQWRMVAAAIDAVKEGSRTPASWREYGPVPSADDGLRQTRVSCAIEESAATGKPVGL